MTCVYASRFACRRIGAMSVTVTESVAGAVTFTASADESHSFYHGDSTDDTSDGIPVADDGSLCFGVWLEDKLNADGTLLNTYTVAFAPTTGLYTISRATGSATFALTFSTLGAAGTRMRQALGFDGDQSTATSQTSDICPRYWLICGGDRAEYSDRQPSNEVVRGSVVYTSNGRVSGVAPYAIPYRHAWLQRFASHALSHNSQDATAGGDAWTMERFFEHHRDGERFLFFPSTVVGTSACSYSNRDRAYSFSQAGIDGWEVRRIIPNSNLYWEVPFDCVEYDTGNPAGADPALLSWADMTFTRSTVATYRTSAATLTDAAINEARYEVIGDANGSDLLLIEGARTNLLLRSETLDGNWAEENATLTNNVALDPFGAVNAVDVESTTSGAGYNRSYMTNVVSAGSMYTFSVWYRDGDVNTGAHDYSISVTDGITPTSQDITRTGTWTRARVRMTPAASPMAAIIYPHTGGDSGPRAASGDDARYIAAQVELGRFGSSYVRSDSGSTTARTADTATWSDSVATMRSGRWQIIVRPIFGSSDMTSGDICVVASFVDANNSVRIRHNGSDIKVEAYAGSAVKASSSAITWSADQTLRLTLDCGAATVAVTGATTGNGTGSAGTAWTWSTGTFRLGGNVSGTAEAFAALSLPMAA